jgi:hypothetical protein
MSSGQSPTAAQRRIPVDDCPAGEDDAPIASKNGGGQVDKFNHSTTSRASTQGAAGRC